MLERVHIHALRRINDLVIEGLAPLTILVGRNGTGKSTILDGILIAASPVPEDAIGRVVLRRVGIENGARWLFPNGESSGEGPGEAIRVGAKGERGERKLQIAAERISNPRVNVHEESLLKSGHPGPYTSLSTRVDGSGVPKAWTVVAFDNAYGHTRLDDSFPRVVDHVRLLDSATPYLPGPIADRYSRLLNKGRRMAAERVLSAVAERKSGSTPTLTIGSEGGRSYLMKLDGTGIPVAAGGDGTRALVRGALELAEMEAGVFLYEEPELHLHPGAQRELAAVMCETVQRGVQVILTTHSLELIDYLLFGMREALEKVAVFRTDIREGEHSVWRIAGSEAAGIRDEIDEDLR